MSSKIAKGSFLLVIGAFLFRIGGYIYKVAMANLLGPSGYGILSLTWPLQNFLIMIATAGLPPAIAKHVSEYYAKDETEMVKVVVDISIRMMIALGLIFSVVIFILAKPIAIGLFNKPEAIIPFQLIALITPFSVIVGALRGTFQGFYQMKNILITRAFELFFMVTVAIGLVFGGFYVAGAVVGTAVGFMMAMVAALYLFQRDVRGKLNPPRKLLARSRRQLTVYDKYNVAKMLIFFSVPVVITGLAELALYDTGTLVIGHYMASSFAGYFNVASTVARFPLIISMAVATSVLPAAAEAMSLNNHDLLRTYILQSYRYVSFVVMPLCVGTIVFAAPIISILFGNAYLPGAVSLQILAAGMLFFTLYTISSSIAQGLGRPKLPMYVLIFGTVIDIVLSIILVPTMGINGAAIATTVAALILMSVLMWRTLKLARVSLPIGEFGKIIIASIGMGIVFITFPQTKFYLIVALILSPFVYIGILSVIGGLKLEDVRMLYKVSSRLGPLSGIINNLISLIERFAR
jgi:stage V sporulation protein B